MKLLYAALVPEDCTIYKKVDAQITAFLKIRESSLIEEFYYLNTKQNKDKSTDFYIENYFKVRMSNIGHINILNNILYKYPRIYLNLYRFMINENIDVLYIRKPPIFDLFSIFFFYTLKKNGLRIFFEIPTYPYDAELKGHKVLFHLDRLARIFLKNCIYKIITFSADSRIYGVNCTNISNGVDLSKIKLKINDFHKDKIVFTCVAGISFWHQIDRFLRAIDCYYKSVKRKEKIIFNIVGDGQAKLSLEKMVEQSEHLKQIVVFHGLLYDKELDAIFEETDVGVGNLEENKTRGLKEVKPLKHREYAARGIPFIYGLRDFDFDDKPYIYRINDGDIEFEKIVSWYKHLNIDKQYIRNDCQAFTWEQQFIKVLTN